jgi:hypothetical protein
VPPAVVRALIGAALTALPAFDERLGAASLPVVCCGLAAFAAVAALVTSRSEATRSWPLNGADALTLALVTPVVAVAAGIAVADIRLGGASENFLAAAVATLSTVAIVTIVVAITCARMPGTAAIALVPAVLVVAAAIAGAERYSGDYLGQGLSATWMVASLVTIIDGLAPIRWRSIVPLAGFAVFAIAVAAVSGSGDSDISGSNAGLALVTTGASGAMLLLAPLLANHAGGLVSEPPSASRPRD